MLGKDLAKELCKQGGKKFKATTPYLPLSIKEKLIAFSSTGQMGALRWFDRYSYNGRPFAYRVSYIHVIQVLDNGARIYAGAAYGFAYYDLDGAGVFKVEQNRNRIEKIVVPLWVQTSRP